MNLKKLFRRRPRIERGREFGHRVKTFQLPSDGQVDYAQWLHPSETEKSVEQEVVDALREFISPGDFVIDIGAHTGDTTVPMALAAGAGGLTLALEPNPYVFKILSENSKLNRDKTNIVPLPYAATHDDGSFTFHYSDGGFCNGGFRSQQRSWRYKRTYPLAVEGRNLQRIVETNYASWLPKLSYVKVDAEGYDLRVLQSIEPLIKTYRPVIASEVYKKLVLDERHALYDFLAGLGYRVHLQVDHAASLIGSPLGRDNLMDQKHFDVIALPNHQTATAAA
jgi:FkbM family methyltransferase